MAQRRRRGRGESGQVIVMLALMLPVFFGLGAIVIDVGNWYVHKRHLQTQVDAAAMAPGPEWVGCFFAPPGANQAIATKALEFAGDTTRDPATTNLQLQEPNDVHVLLNSNTYWNANPYPPDNTLDTDGDGSGEPCNESALEVRATDHDAPLLWGLIPLNPSPKAKARVEIRKLRETQGMLPLAVPEVDPQAVAAIFVNEENGSVVNALELIPGPCPPNAPYNCWALDFPEVELNYDNMGVVVLVSRDNENPSLSGTLTQICGQDPGLVLCYAGDGNESGLSFIHGYSGGGGVTLQAPRVRNVELVDVNCAAAGDRSSPYFLYGGACDVLIRAVVDFDITGGTDPGPFPNCVEVEANPGGVLSWAGNLPEGSLFEGVISLAEESGPNEIDLTTRSRNPARANCSQQITNTFNKMARPYVGNAGSGPIQYMTVERLSPPFGFANSTEKNPAPQPVRVTVGLQRSLELVDAREPPILLRMGSNPGSQTQALDCDTGSLTGDAGPHSNFRNEFIDGCLTEYSINFDDWDSDGDDEWIDIDCSEHVYGNQPPPAMVNDPTPNCIAVQTGVSAGQFQQALQARFASPCSLNYWPPDDATDTEVIDFFRTHDFDSDPRYVTLVVADFTAFSGSGSAEPRPLKIFAGFYYTGSGSVSCTGDDPHPLGVTGQRARFDMWGHFVNRVEWSGAGTPSDTLCQFEGDPSACIATLVE